MPIESSVKRQERLVHTVCHGIITPEDFIDYQQGVWQDESLFGFNELFDTRPGDFSQFQFTDLLTVARNAAQIPAIDPHSKFAIIITHGRLEDLLQFYATAKNALPARSRAIKSFYCEEEAMKWLQE
jgi:hypothetical protein